MARPYILPLRFIDRATLMGGALARVYHWTPN